MNKTISAEWPRLAHAAADARDALRELLPHLERAIAAGSDATLLLARVRQLAAQHAEGLKAALKAPERPRGRQNRRSEASRNVWDAAAPSGGRYLPRAPRRVQPHENRNEP